MHLQIGRALLALKGSVRGTGPVIVKRAMINNIHIIINPLMTKKPRTFYQVHEPAYQFDKDGNIASEVAVVVYRGDSRASEVLIKIGNTILSWMERSIAESESVLEIRP